MIRTVITIHTGYSSMVAADRSYLQSGLDTSNTVQWCQYIVHCKKDVLQQPYGETRVELTD